VLVFALGATFAFFLYTAIVCGACPDTTELGIDRACFLFPFHTTCPRQAREEEISVLGISGTGLLLVSNASKFVV